MCLSRLGVPAAFKIHVCALLQAGTVFRQLGESRFHQRHGVENLTEGERISLTWRWFVDGGATPVGGSVASSDTAATGGSVAHESLPAAAQRIPKGDTVAYTKPELIAWFGARRSEKEWQAASPSV